MNNDQTKSLLLNIRDCQTDFTVTMSGKGSKYCNGLYKPDSREIILHNKNFKSDNEMVYTAIHEYAHHLQAEAAGGYLSPRAHGNSFWALFHELLEMAEKKELYRNVFEEDPAFSDLAARIKRECMSENGKLMIRMGELMVEAEELCREHGARFEDFLDRVLGVSRVTARAAMKISILKVNPDLGYDNQKIVASIRDPEKRAAVEREFIAGKSPDSVKAALRKTVEAQDPAVNLQRERERLEKSIENLNRRLAEVEKKIKELGE